MPRAVKIGETVQANTPRGKAEENGDWVPLAQPKTRPQKNSLALIIIRWGITGLPREWGERLKAHQQERAENAKTSHQLADTIDLQNTHQLCRHSLPRSNPSEIGTP